MSPRDEARAEEIRQWTAANQRAREEYAAYPFAQGMTTPPCTYDPEMWFTDAAEDVAAAKALCHRCPLLDACRILAENLRPEYGVWAGLARDERPRGGRPIPEHRRGVTDTDITLAIQMRANGFTVRDAARHLGVGFAGLQKALERSRRTAA